MRLAILFLAATPAMAQDTVPAPEYFVTSAMATSTAQIVAVNCGTLSVNPAAMTQSTDATLAALAEDGFTPENLTTRMQDPGDRIAVLQQAFMEKHGLTGGATETTVCAAGRREITEGTEIGALLLEVER